MPREYNHCLSCLCPLEKPRYRAAITEVFYIDFAVCGDCKKELLAAENPALSFTIYGDTLKEVIKNNTELPLAYTVIEETPCQGG